MQLPGPLGVKGKGRWEGGQPPASTSLLRGQGAKNSPNWPPLTSVTGPQLRSPRQRGNLLPYKRGVVDSPRQALRDPGVPTSLHCVPQGGLPPRQLTRGRAKAHTAWHPPGPTAVRTSRTSGVWLPAPRPQKAGPPGQGEPGERRQDGVALQRTWGRLARATASPQIPSAPAGPVPGWGPHPSSLGPRCRPLGTLAPA